MKSTLRGTIAKAIGVGAVFAASTAISGLAFGINAAEAPALGNIDADKTGTVTIFKHKYQSGETKTGNIYDKTDTIGAGGVKDVVFKYFPFTKSDGSTLLPLTGADANTNWKALSSVESSALAAACESISGATKKPTLNGFNFGEGVDVPATDGSGKAAVSGLKVGAYLFCEASAPKDVVGKAAPMLITIPRPDKDADKANKWHYDVTVYPKNSITGITKNVKLQEATKLGLGETISWPVAADIPVLGEGEHLSYMVVADPMADVRIKDRGVSEVKINETALTKDTDYKVTINTDQGKEYVAVGLTKAGLLKAETAVKANAASKLHVVFTSTLKAIGDGRLANKATLYVGKTTGETPETPPTDIPDIPNKPEEPPSDEAKSYWGKIKLHKIDAASKDSTNVGLAGAKFKVYAVTDNAKAYPGSQDACKNLKKASGATAISINGTDTFTSNDKGEVVIPGLWVSDSKNTDVAEKTFRCYVVEEVEAPAGYVLPTDPQTGIAVQIGGAAEDGFDTVITNTKTTVPNLPLTGGTAQVVLPIAGALLVAGGVFAAIAYRRRKEDQ